MLNMFIKDHTEIILLSIVLKNVALQRLVGSRAPRLALLSPLHVDEAELSAFCPASADVSSATLKYPVLCSIPGLRTYLRHEAHRGIFSSYHQCC